MGKRQKDMDICPFSDWRARAGISECASKFHQSPETKKRRSVEVQALARLALKNNLQ